MSINEFQQAMKKCTKCHKAFENSFFYKNKSKKCGLDSYCKACRQENSKVYLPKEYK